MAFYTFIAEIKTGKENVLISCIKLKEEVIK